MRLILGDLNGEHLINLLLEADKKVAGQRRVEEVWAAVAYATDSKGSLSLISHCLQQSIPLRFWGRLDDQVAVDIGTLNLFLSKASPDFVCKLVPKHHAKVIWWRGFGVYIGSANLTYPAWNSNVEAGCFLEEDELDPIQADELEKLFSRLDEHASPLTDELRNLMIERAKKLKFASQPDPDFWKHPSVKSWSGLITTTAKSGSNKQRDAFLTEWNETLQHLRGIAKLVSRPEFRPSWINDDTSPGAQADQFLHAHYYRRTFQGQQARYETWYENNKLRREAALLEAAEWWAALPSAPSNNPGEDVTVNEIAPRLAELLAEDHILTIGKAEFKLEIADNVHAMVEYARRVRNEAVNLPATRPYTMEEKLEALAEYLWAQRNGLGQTAIQVLHEVLYGGAPDLLPERLWEAVSNPSKKISRMGISALGETIGWAAPDRFPPRNGRTSKALRSLGYDVKVHVG